jgi:hypothetical protein
MVAEEERVGIVVVIWILLKGGGDREVRCEVEKGVQTSGHKFFPLPLNEEVPLFVQLFRPFFSSHLPFSTPSTHTPVTVHYGRHAALSAFSKAPCDGQRR